LTPIALSNIVVNLYLGNNFDEYPNEIDTLPTNLKQLVTEAMQTITLESSTFNYPKMNWSSTSDIM